MLEDITELAHKYGIWVVGALAALILYGIYLIIFG